MPTFTPPTAAGNLVGEGRLWRFYGSWAEGQTVWKDALGTWHTQLNPYQGGNTHTVHDGDTTTVTTQTGVDELANADEVYHGGHVYEVTEAKATELIAAGFVVGGHFTSEEDKWVAIAVASDANKGWKGGDGFATQPITNAVVCVFSDNVIGTLDGDGYYATEAVSRNAFVVLDANGDFSQQVFPGGTQPGFQHPTPGHWYWPLDVTTDGVGTALNNVIVAGLEMGPGAGFGELLGSVLLTLNVFGGVDTQTTITHWGTDWQVITVYNDSVYHYCLANGGLDGDTGTGLTYTILSRVPLGSLTTMGSWEHWTGNEWSTTFVASPLVDSHGNRIVGSSTITKSGSWWVLAAQQYDSPAIRLYKSTSPQGPFTAYHTEDAPQPPGGLATDPLARGEPPNGGYFAYYQPKFHEWLAPNSAHLVVSYNRNVFGFDFPNSLTVSGDNNYHVSTFCPQFVYVPAPQ